MQTILNKASELQQFVKEQFNGRKMFKFSVEEVDDINDPKFRNLHIFSTGFGQAFEEYINQFCRDSSILDDTYDVVDIGTQHPGTGKGTGTGTGTKRTTIIGPETVTCVVQFKEKYMLVKGHLQSGKTKFMIGTAAKHLMFGKSPIILLRNITNDHIQTKDRIEAFKDSFGKFASNRGIFPEDYHFEIKVFDELSPAEDIVKMLTANPPVIGVLLSNEKSMAKITDQIDLLETSAMNYTLFIDEVDAVDSTTADIRQPLITKLKDNAGQVIGVSATILGTYAEWDVKPECVRELSTPVHYLGLIDLRSIKCDTGKKSIKTTDSIDEIFAAVPYLKDHLAKVAKGTIISRLCGQNQAMVDLVSITHYIEPQKKIFDYMIETHPDVANILMVEDGIRVYHPSLGTDSIKIHRNKSKVDGFIHSFSSKVDVGAALGLLEKTGVKKIRSVLVLAGNKASRAITFSSSGLVYATEAERIRRWHVKRSLIKFSENISQDEAMQRAGRLCGVFAPGSEQIIYASAMDLETIKKAYHAQEDLLNATARKYGKMQLEKRAASKAPDAEIIEVLTWKQEKDIKEELEMGGNFLLKHVCMSRWKTSVHGKTPTGRDKLVKRDITMRNSVRPYMVQDDGRNQESDFDFVKKTIIPKEPEVEIEVDQNEPVHGGSFADEILRILALYSKLTSVEIADRSPLRTGATPYRTFASTCSTLYNKGKLSREGTAPFKYSLKI